MDGALDVVTLATSLGSGLVAGAFFAFSSFVMPALARLPSVQGVAAMQSINRFAVTPVFMAAFFGTALLSLGLIVWVTFFENGRSTGLLLTGGAFYLLGTFGLTVVRNVPLNNRLATVDPMASHARREWEDYVARWTVWNHVRTIAALIASVLLIVAL